MEIESIGKPYLTRENSYFFECDERELERIFTKLASEGARICSITGRDDSKKIEITYIFSVSENIICVKFSAGRKDTRIHTITGIFPAAKLFERELSEMLGVEVEGNRDPERLFLAEDSPQSPLRKTK